MEYIISCSSTADLPKSYFIENNIPFVKFHYEVDGVSYLDDLGESMPIETFYQKLKEGSNTKTSQVNQVEYTEFFNRLLNKYDMVLHLELSSGISGSYNSARFAAEEINSILGKEKIIVIDSLAASSGLGLLLDTAITLRNENKTIYEVKDFIEENKLRIHHWFFSTNLEAYMKGGRISKTSFVLGSLLNIIPLLNVSNEGKLVVRKKLHGKRNLYKEIEKCIIENIDNEELYDGKVFMCNSACEKEANTLATLIKDLLPNMKGKVMINNIGTTIGAHTGVGTIAIFFYGRKREN